MIASHPAQPAQRGAALIMALLVVALATTLSTTLLWRQDMWLRQVEMQRDLAQTRLIADAGIEWGRAVLAYDARTSAFDHLGEAWAIKVPTSRVEGGAIAACGRNRVPPRGGPALEKDIRAAMIAPRIPFPGSAHRRG